MPQVFISSQTEKEIWENAFFPLIQSEVLDWKIYIFWFL